METYNKVFVSRRFNCSKSELFDWLVRPELITKWFGPKQLSIGSVQTGKVSDGSHSGSGSVCRFAGHAVPADMRRAS